MPHQEERLPEDVGMDTHLFRPAVDSKGFFHVNGTDIIGANTFGIDTALVLSGNTQSERAEVLISASGIIPTYMCQSILT